MKDTTNLVIEVMTRKQRSKPIGFKKKIELPTEMAIKWATTIRNYIASIAPQIEADRVPQHATDQNVIATQPQQQDAQN